MYPFVQQQWNSNEEVGLSIACTRIKYSPGSSNLATVVPTPSALGTHISGSPNVTRPEP